MCAISVGNSQDNSRGIKEDSLDKVDIDYLTSHFTEAELRYELHNVDIQSSVAKFFCEDWDLNFWQWYGRLCQKALDTLRSNRLKPVIQRSRFSVKDVKQSHDVVDVISSYIHLRKVNNEQFLGLCPFHQEEHPSFGVNTKLQRWHCLGCDRSGDVVDFVAQIEDLSIKEACLKLGTKSPSR